MASTIAKSGIFFTRSLKHSARVFNVLNQSRNVNTKVSKLVYCEFGEPHRVIQKVDEDFPENIGGNEVLVKMLASPVNPADINTIEGKYPVKPCSFPAVGGNEGVGEILELGKQVTSFNVGDRVVLYTNGVGTWRTHLVTQYQWLYKIPEELGIIEAATLTVNPCTAYRMLSDFVKLKPGDTVIQNGANSAAGQYVIQIAKNWGINTVNIVRDRPTIDELKNQLCNLGATRVLTEEELRTTNIFKCKELPKPKLALNCVGGKSSLELLRHLDKSATMVTYGGMSRQPVTIPTGPLIFKNLIIRGFWMTEWANNKKNDKERQKMFDEIIKMMLEKKLKGPSNCFIPLDDYKDAIMSNVEGKTGRKYILKLTDC